MVLKSVTEDTRREIIGMLKDKTKTNEEIAKLLGISEKCVWDNENNRIR